MERGEERRGEGSGSEGEGERDVPVRLPGYSRHLVRCKLIRRELDFVIRIEVEKVFWEDKRKVRLVEANCDEEVLLLAVALGARFGYVTQHG